MAMAAIAIATTIDRIFVFTGRFANQFRDRGAVVPADMAGPFGAYVLPRPHRTRHHRPERFPAAFSRDQP
ncbi:hypothetical protein JCM9534A_04760 [Catenuloplanes indicus JCM 9534]